MELVNKSAGNTFNNLERESIVDDFEKGIGKREERTNTQATGDTPTEGPMNGNSGVTVLRRNMTR